MFYSTRKVPITAQNVGEIVRHMHKKLAENALDLSQIFPDTGCHRQILDLRVKCPHSGCSWTGELRAVEKHQSECLFKVVKCPNSGCTEMLSKRHMKTHETSKCSWRKVNCEYCQESVIMNQKQKHFDICREFPVVCTNKCGLKDIPRKKLEVHVRDDCPATEIQCEFKNLGCKEVFPRSDAKSHSQTQIERHLNLALHGLEANQRQVNELVTLVKDQSQQIERQSQQIERQSRQIERLMFMDNKQSQQVGRLSEKMERLMSKDKEQSEKMARSMSAVHDQPPQIERRKPIGQIIPTPFEWKTPNLEAVLGRSIFQTQSVVSEPFCLFERGYKHLLKIELPSTPYQFLLGVYIKVVPGEFDELLPWPCKEKVRVTVIDQGLQSDKRIDRSDVIDFEKGKRPCSQPLGDNYDEYRRILQLGRADMQSGSYIKNNTILIRANRE